MERLPLILILLGSAVVVVTACRAFRLPPILGYLLVGIAVGPHALAWVPGSAEARDLAEFGIVFLMFSIGLEFSLPALRAMRRAVFGLGLAQVVITTVVGLIVLPLVGASWQAGLALGGAWAMSSTAIVSKMLAERMELTTPHGRDAMGILLFQDLAVVAFLVIITSLGKTGADLAWTLAVAALKATAALALILFLGQRPMRAWFHVVARARSPELFMLNVLLVTLGLAELTALSGLSLALGAFLAGMLIAETEYRYQVEDDIKPFRDVLLGLFFVTVGMAFDLTVVASQLPWVLLTLVLAVLLKLVLIVGLARAFGASLAAALRTGFYLAQAGEFALVMVTLAVDHQILPVVTAQTVLAAMVLSMLAAPLVIHFADPIVRRFTANDWLARAAQLTQIAATSMARQNHVLICGFGRSGQSLARLLGREDVPFVALDSDPQRVREAVGFTGNVVYGDAGRKESLLAAGIAKARAVAITFSDTPMALRILHHVRELRPDLPVVVRSVDDTDIERLKAAGATEVVAEVHEGSLMLASHALLLGGVPLAQVRARVQGVREERYSLLRAFFHGASDSPEGSSQPQQRLHSVLLADRAQAVGKRLSDLALPPSVEVQGVRRRSGAAKVPDADWIFEAGDVIVLLGTPEQLAAAEQTLL